MNIWTELDEFVLNMFRFTNGKRVMLWGYDGSGFFIHHLFQRVNRKIEYIVDDRSGINPKIKIMRSVELESDEQFSPYTTVVIITEDDDKNKEIFLEKRGFVRNVNYVYAYKLLYSNLKNIKWRKLSYYDYLENKYNVDILDKKLISEIERSGQDSLSYSPGLGYTLVDVLDNFVFTSNDAVFDFGCGKGGALLLFLKNGLTKAGGVEYDKELYGIAVDNFKKLGVAVNGLLNADAAQICEELDEYNYFYLYNPFQGDTFKAVINNIEKSWNRNKRRITIIYSGPYCHQSIVEHEIFRLSKQIYTDFFIRMVNIYITA